MKATISEFEHNEGTLWEGEILSVNWNSDQGEFVICGNPNDENFNAVVTSIVEKQRLTIDIEDSGANQLVWHGYIGSAEFQPLGPEQMECSLTMSLDDWFGIIPNFRNPHYS